MVDRYLSPKFSVNAIEDFRENYAYGQTNDGRTDGRRTDDGCLHHGSSSAVQ